MSEITLTIGDTSVLDITIYQDENPMDLTGYDILFTVKKPFYGAIGLNSPKDEEAAITKSTQTSCGGIETYGVGGIRVVMGSLDTKDLVDGIYDYDIQLSKPGDQDSIITVDSGNITFTKEITRRNAPL